MPCWLCLLPVIFSIPKLPVVFIRSRIFIFSRRLSNVSVAAFNTTNRWQTWAMQYAWGDLAAHEWAKHGSCTPWSKTVDDQIVYWQYQEGAYVNATAGSGAVSVSNPLPFCHRERQHSRCI